MKKLLLIITLLLASPAFAQVIQQNGSGHASIDSHDVTIDSGNTYDHSGNTSVKVDASAKQHQQQRQQQRQNQGQEQSADNAGNNQTLIQNYQPQKRNPVSSAWAAPLTAADDTCMGSTTAGGQGVGFGISLGSTWKGDDCVRRKDARELHNMGEKEAALALLCQSEKVAKAMRVAGKPCPGDDGDLAPSAAEAHTAYATGGIARIEHDYPTGNRFGRN